ncbi:MAG: hypothetical protein HS115_02120 [Spirochaetales bacterium]|nr:hypothetical protein [Spirochaetales bacterium]
MSASPARLDDSERRKYFPVFENLALFLLDLHAYGRALRAYLKEEAEYRGLLLFQVLLFFVLGLVCMALAMVFLMLTTFLLLRLFLGSAILAMGLVFLLALAGGVSLMFLFAARIRLLTDAQRHQRIDEDW